MRGDEVYSEDRLARRKISPAPARRSLKIVDVAEFYAEEGGGVRTYINQRFEAAAREGHEIAVIAPGPEDRIERRPGGKVIWVKGATHPIDHRYHVFSRPAQIHELLNRENPDVVEGSSPWKGGWIVANWPGAAVKSFFIHQDPVAVYPQTFLGRTFGEKRVDWMCGWFWAYLRKLSARYDTSIVSGEWLADRLERFRLRRPFAAPFGIDKGAFSPARRDPSVKEEMLRACGVCDPDAPLLVAVSRHHPEKRLGAMMKAFRKVRAERPIGLYLIGDGPMRRWVERKARHVEGVYVAGKVKNRDRLAACLASADVMVHGGAAETYGLVVAEAICSGLPLVAPDTGGAADLADPRFAETYRAGDAAAFADAIKRILARDRETLSAQAVRCARERIWSPDDHFRMLFGHYLELVEAREGARIAA
ncbi:MAG: glycosyltransferase family 1 protein [Parvularculaceae bacterium]